jgi:hypothetical protein
MMRASGPAGGWTPQSSKSRLLSGHTHRPTPTPDGAAHRRTSHRPRGPAQLGVLPPQTLELVGLLARRIGPDSAIDLGLADPLAHPVPTPSFCATAFIAAHDNS